MNDWNKNIISEFRENKGMVGGPFEGAPLLLLHHKGAKSSTDRLSPLTYQAVDGGFAVFASKGGADTNPDWFHNLKANPVTKVEVGTDVVDVKARVAEGAEHDQIWTTQKAQRPQFAEYEQKTSRDRIPVVVLDVV